jgi:hypothetical protein
MGKLVEDADVVTFAPATPVTSAGFLNPLQAQLRATHKERELNCTSLFVPDNADANNWDLNWAAGPGPTWVVTGAPPAGDDMVCWLPVRIGEKIVKTDITYLCNNQNGGEIALYERQGIAVGASAALINDASLFDIGENAANPWNPAANPTWYHRVQTTVSTIVAAGYQYYVYVQAPAAGGVVAVADFRIHVQFGN